MVGYTMTFWHGAVPTNKRLLDETLINELFDFRWAGKQHLEAPRLARRSKLSFDLPTGLLVSLNDTNGYGIGAGAGPADGV
jgi:hypothetical protein